MPGCTGVEHGHLTQDDRRQIRLIGAGHIRQTGNPGIHHPVLNQLEIALDAHDVGAPQEPSGRQRSADRWRTPVGRLKAQGAIPQPACPLVHGSLQAQKRLVANQLPFTIDALHGEAKDLERLGAGAAHRGLTDPKSLAHLLHGAEPLKAIERRQYIQLNQAASAVGDSLWSDLDRSIAGAHVPPRGTAPDKTAPPRESPAPWIAQRSAGARQPPPGWSPPPPGSDHS